MSVEPRSDPRWVSAATVRKVPRYRSDKRRVEEKNGPKFGEREREGRRETEEGGGGRSSREKRDGEERERERARKRVEEREQEKEEGRGERGAEERCVYFTVGHNSTFES